MTSDLAGLEAKDRPRSAAHFLLPLALIATLALAFTFVAIYVFHYFWKYSPAELDVYWPRRFGLLVHITAGTIAILIGPWQLWSGFRGKFRDIHRWTGRLFIASVLVGACAAYYLAVTTTFGWGFGFGLAGLATAWLATTFVAYYAILNGAVAIHRRWVIRAYVVTFGFVTFRLVQDWLPTSNWKPVDILATTDAWACWSIPLLATIVIQAVIDVHRRAA
jgi:uncharacterized membrane protein